MARMQKPGYFYHRKLELRLIIVFVAISIILLFLGWQALRNNQAAVEAQDRVIEINQQLRSLNRFMIAMFNTETGQRGYLLTENPAYLEPYEMGLREIGAMSRQLAVELENEVSPALYRKIDALKKAKLDELENTIRLVQQGRRAEALAIVQSDVGKQKMDQIRAEIAPVLDAKRIEVSELSRLAKKRAQHARWSLYTLISAVLLFIICAYVLVIRELSEKRRLRQRIEESTSMDAVTGLMARSNFLRSAALALKQAHREKIRAAVLWIDLKNFQMVNERYGYEAGDTVLKEFSRRLVEAIRQDDQACRFWEDKFAVLVPHVETITEIEVLVQRILQSLIPPLAPFMREQYLGASIGIALYPDDAEVPEQLIQYSEVACGKAKEEGKRSYRFYEDSIALSVQRIEAIRQSLPLAVVRQEFALNFQPQVAVASNEIVAVEALIRWHHSELGEVHPDEFIPYAEKLGLITPIGAWVLQQSCRHILQWHAAGCKWRLAVNVSPVELVEGHYAEMVTRVLENTGLQPPYLEIEVTERTLLDRTAMAELEKLKRIGVLVSLDDFGTGYSSLSYLAQFPVDYLKIDQIFIRGLPDSKTDTTLVNSMISMSKELEIGVIAEGVESEVQLDYLRNKGCDLVQGYIHYPPLRPQAVEEQLVRRG
ncbi:MAG TPA: EAL domain-containing protein [Methylophilaceae bacterium]|nr:EAL domain-containing protein [Methylophilaceae bacterium]